MPLLQMAVSRASARCIVAFCSYHLPLLCLLACAHTANFKMPASMTWLHPVCRPAHALYFATYELAKQSLGGNDPGHHPLATAVAGSIATIVNDGVMTPSDVVKQRLQVANSPYRGMIDCILRVSREEGISAFFKSYKTTVTGCSFASVAAYMLSLPMLLCA